MADARTHLAWLMWCWMEDYRTPRDREIMENWLLLPDTALHPDDIEQRRDLLAAADEVLAALAAECTP